MNKQQEFDWTTFVQKAITFLVLLGIGRAGGFVAERLGYPPSLGRWLFLTIAIIICVYYWMINNSSKLGYLFFLRLIAGSAIILCLFAVITSASTLPDNGSILMHALLYLLATALLLLLFTRVCTETDPCKRQQEKRPVARNEGEKGDSHQN